MNLWQLFAIGIFGMIVSQIVKQIIPSFSVYSSLATSILLTVAALVYIQPVADFAMQLSSGSGLGRIPSVMLKLCAIAVITGLSADICIDAGESAIAGRITLLGKCASIATVLPVIEMIVESTKDFLM